MLNSSFFVLTGANAWPVDAAAAAGEIKGRKLIGKVSKLSNMGYSQHLRILKLNHKGLSYYKKVPDDFNEKTMQSDTL